MNSTDNLGEFFVHKMRDQYFKDHVARVEWSRTMSIEEYRDRPKNPNVDPVRQKSEDLRNELYIGLSEAQVTEMNKLILSTIDNNNFLLLREAEESKIDDSGLGFLFDGINVDDFSEELLSGTLFGEYFLWVEKFSEFGKFVH